MAIRIGLIDDDASVRRELTRLLRSHECDCLAYPSGEAALDDPNLAHADFLIVDVQLSGIDGFTLRDRLRARGISTPMVFITAFAGTDSPDWRRKLGTTPYLVKPFEAQDLFATIGRALRRKRGDVSNPAL